MSTDGASQQGAEGEEYPTWFSAYLRSLNVKKEEVRAAELDTVLQTCEDVSQVFRSNISAAYRSESKLEAARKAEAEALTQTLLHNPVSYVARYPEFPWSLISPEQGNLLTPIRWSQTPGFFVEVIENVVYSFQGSVLQEIRPWAGRHDLHRVQQL